ncbi:MAG: iron ABC transporter permease [Thermomicrobiales bacterium]|nr:iron ABC transporter permease [Thermomicrobiales bacterium]
MIETVAPSPQNRPGHHTLRRGPVAVRVNLRALFLSLVAAGTLTLMVLWAVGLGTIDIPMIDVARAILGNADERTELVVRTLRLPRILAAALVGAALAISGTIFQGIARNPLVSPDIIGINSGATLFAMAAMILGIGTTSVPMAAFLGAMAASILIYVLSWKNGVSTNRMILVGIGIGAVIGAGTTYLTIRFPIEVVRPAIVWSMGSFYARNWDDVTLIALTVLALLPAGMVLMDWLQSLQYGDVLTRSLGVPLERTRLILIAVGCALSAVSVSIAGPIGFVALIVPHMARMIAGPPTSSGLLFTALLGANMLLLSDIVAQHALSVSLPVGIVTGAVGAPYFLFLLYRYNRRLIG